MGHRRMYDEDDPLLARTRSVCLALPETSEKESHGRPTFFAGRRVFAQLGIAGEGDTRLVVRPDGTDREALLHHPRASVPPYYGPSGWLAFELRPLPGQADADWEELAELVEDSYRQVALVRMLRVLDARG
ncbi:MmcQ/YjbR family DNA-binding protein [Aquipuribacter sp. MA13-6]|uniref:MmcQ/YjbR family DNA-binding protein n=1 Tax=unclassified Aquipuribacter TaxID=2635084 RepID=UPI003EEB91D8